jgi:hypothetical protein
MYVVEPYYIAVLTALVCSQIAHVIREIRLFQQTPYKIDLITKVTNYLLDPSLLLDDEELYRMSLEIEPRTSRLSSSAIAQLPLSQNPPRS